MLQSGIELGVEGGRGGGRWSWGESPLNWMRRNDLSISFCLSMCCLWKRISNLLPTFIEWFCAKHHLRSPSAVLFNWAQIKPPLLLSLTLKKDEVPSALGLSPNQRKSSPRLGDSFTLFGNIFWWKNFKYYALSQSSPAFMPWQLRTARPNLMGVSQAHNRANAEWCVDV